MTLRRAGITFALLFASWCGLDVRAAEAKCTYSVSPTSTSALSTGQSGSISVITGGSLRVDGDKRSALDHDYLRRQHDRARLDQLHRRTERHR